MFKACSWICTDIYSLAKYWEWRIGLFFFCCFFSWETHFVHFRLYCWRAAVVIGHVCKCSGPMQLLNSLSYVDQGRKKVYHLTFTPPPALVFAEVCGRHKRPRIWKLLVFCFVPTAAGDFDQTSDKKRGVYGSSSPSPKFPKCQYWWG